MKKITPFLWFDGQAEAAAKFYVSLFKKSKITHSSKMSVSFTLDGQDFVALNGGPHYTMTPAISMYIDCKDQKEVDRLWAKLLKGGTPSRCGWITDKFGLTWQVVPSGLMELLSSKNAAKSQSAMTAMMTMVKLDIKTLKAAYARG